MRSEWFNNAIRMAGIIATGAAGRARPTTVTKGTVVTWGDRNGPHDNDAEEAMQKNRVLELHHLEVKGEQILGSQVPEHQGRC